MTSAGDRFEAHRRRLFDIAYRMTGSVADAEDCVQEAFVRWERVDLDAVEVDEAYLVRIVGRLAIDRQRQVARRKESYVGPWLPEPLLSPIGSPPADGPESQAELADSLSFAFLVLLDRLSPTERAAFLLHDVFGIPFAEVAATLTREPEACRQLASRARRKLREADTRRERVETDADAAGAMGSLLAALAAGDVDACLAQLSPDVVLTSDAGPSRRAARRQVVGGDRVARFLTNLFRRDAPRVSEIHPVSVNGAPGLLLRHVDGPLVVAGDLDDHGRVARIWIQMNPDKVRGTMLQ